MLANATEETQNMMDYIMVESNLTALPSDLDEERYLQTIDVSKNQISRIDSLPQSLIKLVCDHNEITTFMPNGNMPSGLAHLSCAHNQITALPYDIPKEIEYLDCSHNQLTVLSDILYGCWSLKTLIADHNNLIRLPYLPRINKGASLKTIRLVGGRENDPLLKLYPKLQALENAGNAYDIVEYVNKINDDLALSACGALKTSEVSNITKEELQSSECVRPWYLKSAGVHVRLGTPIGKFCLRIELPTLVILGLFVYKAYGFVTK